MVSAKVQKCFFIFFKLNVEYMHDDPSFELGIGVLFTAVRSSTNEI